MFTVRKAIPEDAGAIIEFQLKMAWETEKTTLDRDTVTKGVNAVFSDPGKGEYYVTEAGGNVVA